MPKISKAEAARQKDARYEGMLESTVPLTTRQDYVAEISSLWEDARQRFLYIGRRLMEAHETLGTDEYKAMVEADLPFNMSIAHQLRAVAEAVRDRRLRETELPLSYATAYQLTTLSEKELDTARSEQLVRSDVFRRDIIAFKRRIRTSGLSFDERRNREMAELAGERSRLLKRLDEVEARMSQLNAGALPVDRRRGGTTIDVDDFTVSGVHDKDASARSAAMAAE